MNNDPLISFARKKNGHEVFDAAELTVFETRPSIIAPNTLVKSVSGIRCPRRNKHNPPMHHGDTQRCESCGLNMALHGNGLECW